MLFLNQAVEPAAEGEVGAFLAFGYGLNNAVEPQPKTGRIRDVVEEDPEINVLPDYRIDPGTRTLWHVACLGRRAGRFGR